MTAWITAVQSPVDFTINNMEGQKDKNKTVKKEKKRKRNVRAHVKFYTSRYPRRFWAQV